MSVKGSWSRVKDHQKYRDNLEKIFKWGEGKTMKVRIIADEWYPVFSICEDDYDGVDAVEITEEQHERWIRVSSEFDQVQSEMREAYNRA